MRSKALSIVLGITSVVAMAMGGCGGGDGGGSASQVVSGTASSGAAFNGSVVLKDTRGRQLTTNTNTTTGGFTFDVTGLKAPFILRAGTLYSIANGTGTTNINPFTNVVAKSAAGSSTNLDTVFANISSNRSKLTGISSNLTQAISNFNAAMNQKDSTGMSIYTRYGLASSPDFLHGSITIDKDVDKLFADINVSLSGTTVTVTNKSGATLLSGSYVVSGSTISFSFTPNYTNIKGLSGTGTGTGTSTNTGTSTSTSTSISTGTGTVTVTQTGCRSGYTGGTTTYSIPGVTLCSPMTYCVSNSNYYSGYYIIRGHQIDIDLSQNSTSYYTKLSAEFAAACK